MQDDKTRQSGVPDIKKKGDCRYGFEGFPLCGRKAQPKENSAERLRIWRGEGRQGKVCNEAERKHSGNCPLAG